MTRTDFTLNVLLASLLLSSAASAAGYQFKVNIQGLPPAVWPSCTTPWGDSLAHNGKVFAYSAESVPFGESCDTVKGELTCNKGVLSGAYAHQTCSALAACPVGGKQVYATAGDFTFTLPEGCAAATLTAKVWGAAGGGLNAGNNYGSTIGMGGGGGFASSTLEIGSGDSVTVVVGGSVGGATYSGGGGGASAVLLEGVAQAVGGGGGGTSRTYVSGVNKWYQYSGIAGGGTTNLRTGRQGGSLPVTFPNFVYGIGGTSSYGAGGYCASTNDQRQHTGGGGGGYLGGVAGTTDSAGVGGSSYALNGVTIAGSGVNPGNTADSDYAGAAGLGGGSGGNPGRVVLSWQ